jgi:hypothetical protein
MGSERPGKPAPDQIRRRFVCVRRSEALRGGPVGIGRTKKPTRVSATDGDGATTATNAIAGGCAKPMCEGVILSGASQCGQACRACVGEAPWSMVQAGIADEADAWGAAMATAGIRHMAPATTWAAKAAMTARPSLAMLGLDSFMGSD